jgi:hypothetical protein
VESSTAGSTDANLTTRSSGKTALVATSTDTPSVCNPVALLSLLLSLVSPAGVLVAELAGGVFRQVNPSTPLAYHVGVALLMAGVLTVPLAIVTGHSALDWAKRRAYQWPLHRITIASLVLGYGAVVGYILGSSCGSGA